MRAEHNISSDNISWLTTLDRSAARYKKFKMPCCAMSGTLKVSEIPPPKKIIHDIWKMTPPSSKALHLASSFKGTISVPLQCMCWYDNTPLLTHLTNIFERNERSVVTSSSSQNQNIEFYVIIFITFTLLK